MKEDTAIRAAALVRHCTVAALGTLHEGAPSVTMTPYAVTTVPFAFVVLVSGLAAHTRDMLAEPRVGLMVLEPEGGTTPSHALARVSLQCSAEPIRPGDERYAAVRAAYESRFPDRAMLFGLGDFLLFALTPTAVRAVLGFAQAASIEPASLARALQA